ncbi:MAG: lamin tail domain-containing protein [Candidatus Cloacimonetes bacterium]|nr:lamin tail domain-containing protein [Candidatus Cloacimonadota bacterium]
MVRQAEFPANIYSMDIVGDNIWISGSDGALALSTNNGDSFQFIPSPLFNAETSTYLDGNDIDFYDTTHGVIASEDGVILITSDGGVNWTPAPQVNALVAGEDFEGIVYHSDGKIWAVGRNGNIVYSTDNGQNWVLQTSGVTDWLYGISMNNSGTGFVALNNGSPDQAKVLKTTDFGANWQVVNLTVTGNPTTFNVMQNGNQVLVLGDAGYIGFSSDNGVNWTHHVAAGGTSRMYGAVMNGTEGYAVGWNGTVLYTSDSWANVQTLDANYTYHLQNVMNDSDGNMVAVGWYGSVIRSDDGLLWDELTITSVDLYSMSIVDENTWFGVGDKGYFVKTLDGGDSINRIFIEPMAGTTITTLYSCYFKDDLEGWVSGRTNGVIYHTVNGGVSWTTQQIAGVSSTLGFYEINFISDTVGFAFGPGNLNAKTVDGGASWTAMTNTGISSTTKVLGLHIFDENNIIAGAENGVVYRTNNGGSSWTTYSVGAGDVNDILFVDADNGILVNENGEIYYTTTGGTSAGSWIAASEQSSDDMKHLYATAEGDVYAVGYSSVTGNLGTAQAILKSTNNGQSWVQETLPATTFNPVRMNYITGTEDFIMAIGNNQVAYYEELNGGNNETFATELFFSEYVEGDGGNNKVIELFNGTGAAVDLSEYTVKLASNGGDWGNTYTGETMLAHGGVFVIANAQSNAEILALADATSSVTFFNGDDALGLFHNDVLIDVIGVQGTDPGTSWAVAGDTSGTMNRSLIRKPNIGEGSTDWVISAGTNTDDSQWIVMPANSFGDIGSHTFTGGNTNPTCAMPVMSPNGGIFTDPVTVSITSATQGAQIYYTLDGSEPSETSTLYSAPFVVSTTTTVKTKAFCTDMNPSITVSVLFNFPTIVQVGSIAEMRMGNQDGTVYELTNPVYVTYTQSYRNQKFLMDSTGGMLIDDNSGVISSVYNPGDEITGVMGTITLYTGMIQLVPSVDPGAPISTGHVFTPEVVNLAQLAASFDSYESELIQINNVLFTDAGGTFATGINYAITDGSGNSIFRTQFFDADYIGTTIPSTPMNIVVIALEYNATYEVVARFLSDFTPAGGNVFGSLEGLVTDAVTGNPIQNAIISAGNYSANSGVDGSYLIDNIIAGEFTFSCVANGYLAQSAAVTIVAEQTATLDWDMEINTNPAPIVIINEIMYNSSGYDNEWVELYNTTDAPVSLDGWQMRDSSLASALLPFPAGAVIPANGYYTIAIDHDSQADPFPFVADFDAIDIVGWNLGNTSDAVILFNNQSTMIDSVTYADSNGWPTQADGTGPSLELISPTMDNDLPTSWQASAVIGGTPGAQNSTNGGLQQVATLAELRAAIGATNEFEITSEVVISFMQEFRGQKYIQDDTAGVLIDDFSGVITGDYAVGDGITGLIGTISEYGGMIQFVPTVDPAPATSTGNAVSPIVVTIADLISSFDTYESRLVRINNVSFSGATGNFENGMNYVITDGTDNYNFRTTFYDVNYIGIPIPVEQGNLNCIPNSRTDGEYITARVMMDLDFESAVEENNNQALITALRGNYPNPFNPTTTISFSLKDREMVNLSIYNLKGQKVRTLVSENMQAGNHNLVWNGTSDNGDTVASGIYFYKLNTDSYSSTRKMVMMK